jgi:hypothetical protein
MMQGDIVIEWPFAMKISLVVVILAVATITLATKSDAA